MQDNLANLRDEFDRNGFAIDATVKLASYYAKTGSGASEGYVRAAMALLSRQARLLKILNPEAPGYCLALEGGRFIRISLHERPS